MIQGRQGCQGPSRVPARFRSEEKRHNEVLAGPLMYNTLLYDMKAVSAVCDVSENNFPDVSPRDVCCSVQETLVLNFRVHVWSFALSCAERVDALWGVVDRFSIVIFRFVYAWGMASVNLGFYYAIWTCLLC